MRQYITRVIVHKIICDFGYYPTKAEKQNVAALMGDLFYLNPSCFYDTTSQDGFLIRGLENARRKLTGLRYEIYCNTVIHSITKCVTEKQAVTHTEVCTCYTIQPINIMQ